MRRATLHYLIDVLLGLLSLLLVISSTLLWIVFPRGYHAARALWVEVHKWGGLAVTVTALTHVFLHWQWLLRMTRRQLGRLFQGQPDS